MKKILLICTLLLAIVLSFAACGGNDNHQNNNGRGETQEHTHNFGEWDVTKNPTCAEDGAKVRYCSCGETQNASLPATKHNIVTSVAVTPTCTSTGLTEGKYCSVCNEILLAQQTIPEIAHTYDNQYDEDCNICDYKRDAVCGHFETEVIPGNPATCTATGLTDGTKCKKCGEVVTSQAVIPTKSHTEATIPAVEATCTSTGLTAGAKCSVCEKVLVAQLETPKIAHTYDDKYDESCNKCGFVRDAECAHRETETITGYAASCTATGLTDGKKCKKCGEIITAQTIIPGKAHTEVIDSAVEATCTTAGLTEGKHCSACNEVLIAQTTISALGHTEVIDSAVAATCTTDGKTEGMHCSACNEVFIAQNIISASHQYSTNYECDKYYHWIQCSACNNKKNKSTHILNADGSMCLVCNPNCQPTEGVIYDISKNGTYAEVIRYDGTDTYVKIAEEYNGLPVKTICSEVFYRKSIVTIIIPDSVTYIGERAFMDCRSLKTVVLGEGIETIENFAFWYCSGLQTISIPDKPISIDNSSFTGCTSITTEYNDCLYVGSINNPYHILLEANEVNISSHSVHPDTKIIADGAFYDCSRLSSLVIPKSVVFIGGGAFHRSGVSTIYYLGSEEEWNKIKNSICGCGHRPCAWFPRHIIYNYVPEE